MFFHTGMVKMRCWNTVRDCVRHHVVKIRLLSSYLNKLPHLWCTTVSPSQNWWSPIVTRRGRSDSWSRSSPAGRSLLTTSQARKHAGIRWVWPSRQEMICFDGILFCAWGSPGMSMPDFDNQTLAALRGRMVRYLMRSREVNLGFFSALDGWVTCHCEYIPTMSSLCPADYIGKGDERQTHRRRSLPGGPCLENI